MPRGNKIIGALLVVSLICAMAVFVIEERAYEATDKAFDTIVTDSENRVNLNTATLEELTELEGVGEVIAERIIEFRKETRPFETVYDFKLVRGVGETLFENNKNQITVE